MARPKNLVVVNGNVVLSLPPNKLKEMLRTRASGTEVLPQAGKVVGPIFADLDTMTAGDATALLATLEPAPAPAPETVPAPAPEAVATAPAPA